MNTTSSISKNVMRRVRIMHAVRPLLSTTALGTFLFLLALWGLGREVWVAQVFANMPSLSDVNGVLRFAAAAFLNTRFIVQALVILAGAAVVVVIRDTVRTLGSVRQRLA